MDATAARARHLGGDDQLAVDVHRTPVAHEDARGHRREAVPGRDQPTRLVERSGDEAAVHEPGTALVALVEGKPRLVRREPLHVRWRKMDAMWVVAAAPTSGVVVRRDLQRIPPRSWCARKKFSEPAVAIAAEALISSASVAAATTCAKR